MAALVAPHGRPRRANRNVGSSVNVTELAVPTDAGMSILVDQSERSESQDAQVAMRCRNCQSTSPVTSGSAERSGRTCEVRTRRDSSSCRDPHIWLLI
ncbi:hypothetical protein EXIGLDRAFT_332451 [Exidia glandulosa HHB12029]|uniref:Uncharacterized protein n=1 Tax=Exidia glandulosa HHB12029 TaxID=1314781 RepID=A0A165LL53_EXIGL|nr:hypothetical protein EXIGLDRAFT_332451 [Exidia glandulosa HHB12029]